MTDTPDPPLPLTRSTPNLTLLPGTQVVTLVPIAGESVATQYPSGTPLSVGKAGLTSGSAPPDRGRGAVGPGTSASSTC